MVGASTITQQSLEKSMKPKNSNEKKANLVYKQGFLSVGPKSLYYSEYINLIYPFAHTDTHMPNKKKANINQHTLF